MSRKHIYLSLKYMNMAPCLIRSDKVKSYREMPGGHTEITCKDGRVCLVREPIDRVSGMMNFCKICDEEDRETEVNALEKENGQS